MMLPTIDEENQVLFNIEGDIKECIRCYDDENATFSYVHDDCEIQIMLPNVHKDYQEYFNSEGHIKQGNATDTRSKWKWIAAIFLILFIGSAITVEITSIFLILFVGSAATAEISSMQEGGSWKAIQARFLGTRIR
jgi:hypothetical protein